MLNSQENFAGLYILEKSKGPEMGKEIKEGKKKKKRKFGENITFNCTKSYNSIGKTQFNTI